MFHCLIKNCLPLLDVGVCLPFFFPGYKSFCPQVKIYDRLAFTSSSLKIEKMTFLLHCFV